MQAILLVSVGDNVQLNNKWYSVRSITPVNMVGDPVITLAAGSEVIKLHSESGIIVPKVVNPDATRDELWQFLLPLLDVDADVPPPDAR